MPRLFTGTAVAIIGNRLFEKASITISIVPKRRC
jgi:hypothetical protein